MNDFPGLDVHKIVSSLAVGWSEAYCTGASLLVGVVGTAMYIVVFTKSGFEVVAIDLPTA